MNQNSQSIEKIAAGLNDGRLTINALDDGSGVVLDVDKEQLLTMNATAVMIIQAIADGKRQESHIADLLQAQFEVDEPRAREDIAQFVEAVAKSL